MSQFSVHVAHSYLNRYAFRLKDRLYVVYLVAILALFWGIPGLFSLGGVIDEFGWQPRQGMRVTLGISALVFFLTAVFPRPLALPYTGRREFFYVVRNAGVKAALLSRTLVTLGVAAGLGALIGGVFAASALGRDSTILALSLVVLGAGTGALAGMCSLAIQASSGQKARLIPALIGFGVGVVAFLEAPMLTAVYPVVAWVLLIAGLLLAGTAPSLLSRMRLSSLEDVTGRRKLLLSGVFTQNADVATSTLYRSEKRFRALGGAVPKSPWGQGMWVAWRTLVRTPTRSVSLLVLTGAVGFASAWLTPHPIGTGVSAAVMAYCLTSLNQGLSARITALSGDGHERPRVYSTVLGHAVLPVSAGAALFTCGHLLAALVNAPVSLAGIGVVLALSIPTLFLLAGSATTPVGVFTPVITPLGDASAVGWVLWLLRGCLPATAWLLATFSWGLPAATAVVLAALAALTALRLGRLRNRVVAVAG